MDDTPRRRRRPPQPPIEPQPEPAPEAPARRRRPPQPASQAQPVRKKQKKRKKKSTRRRRLNRLKRRVCRGAKRLAAAVGQGTVALLARTGRFLRRQMHSDALSPQQNAMASLAALAVVLMLIGGGGLLSWNAQTRRTERTNEELLSRYELGQQLAFSQKITPAPLEGSGLSDVVVMAPTATPAPTAAPTPADDQPTPRPTATPRPVYQTIGTQVRTALTPLYEINSDLVGWLSIPGVIDLPVVYRNNVYYETHDFYGREDKAGTLFLDKNHPLRSTTQNLLIHGHNMRDGTMFGRLLQYETNLSYVKDHGIIHFDTIYEEQTYVVFAVMIASFNSSSSRYFDYYTHATFASETEFTNYVYAVRARSLYSIPVDVRADDALLTLSTCLDDDRLVILARRLRDGHIIEQGTHKELLDKGGFYAKLYQSQFAQ